MTRFNAWNVFKNCLIDQKDLDRQWRDPELKDNYDVQLEVKIEHIENLGFEKIIHTKLSDANIIIKSSENVKEESLKISFSKNKVLFFEYLYLYLFKN